jgi:hypothetical protein
MEEQQSMVAANTKHSASQQSQTNKQRIRKKESSSLHSAPVLAVATLALPLRSEEL